MAHLLCLPLAIATSWFSVRAQSMNAGAIVKLDPSLDQIVSAEAKLELLKGEGSFEGGEGPLWIQNGESGYLLFSDVGGNRIFQWTPDCFKYPCSPDGKLSIFLDHSGYADASRVGSVDASGAHLSGSNGLTLDREGRIVVDATGDRAVERLEKEGRNRLAVANFAERPMHHYFDRGQIGRRGDSHCHDAARRRVLVIAACSCHHFLSVKSGALKVLPSGVSPWPSAPWQRAQLLR